MANFRPPVTVANLGYYIFGYLPNFEQPPKIVQFGNYSTIFCTKCKYKGGLFCANKCKLIYLGPKMLAILDKWGCLPISKFFNNFLCKSEIKSGSFYKQNCQLVYLGLHNAGHFEHMEVSANRHKMDQF